MTSDLKSETSKVICKDNIAGTFQFDLLDDFNMTKKTEIICSMRKKIQTENTPTICELNYNYVFIHPLLYKKTLDKNIQGE